MVGNHREHWGDDADLPSLCGWLETIGTIVISHSLWQLGDLELFFLLFWRLFWTGLFICLFCLLVIYIIKKPNKNRILF